MKTVFLILYFWHADWLSNVSQSPITAVGAPVLHFERMPNLRACEVIGQATKEMVDSEQREPQYLKSIAGYAVGRNSMSRPVQFRCVEVN